MAQVLSVNVGRPEPNPDRSHRQTGIGKLPVPEAFVRAPGPKRGGLGSGVVDDFIGSRRHHGGDRQAVYAFAREELDAWAERLGRPVENGLFGENLTTSGLAVDDAMIGDRWSVGDEVVLEVTGPRVPCATFRHRMGERGWVRRFTEHGRTGAYLAVVVPGALRPGDRIEQVRPSPYGIGLMLAFRAFMGDVVAAEQVLASGCLPADEETWLRGRVQRRRRAER